MAMANDLPDIVLLQVFSKLGARDSLAASQTCRNWRWIGVEARDRLTHLRISDFYEHLITERRFIEFPVFHGREDLRRLVFIRIAYVKQLIVWLSEKFPRVTELSFRNYVGDRRPFENSLLHPANFKVFVIDELMKSIRNAWPEMELLDVSGQIVEVNSMAYLRSWRSFKEIRLSGCDLSFHMLKTPYLVKKALKKTFKRRQLEALRMSNLNFNFELSVSKMKTFKALGNTGLTTGWLNRFLDNAVNLESLAIDCRYLHDENVVQIGQLAELRVLILRNCLYVSDFSPISKLSELRTITIDFNEGASEDQLCAIISGSSNWRRVVFNEAAKTVGNGFLLHFARHCLRNSCPVIQFELNTEKKLTSQSRSLPNVDIDGMETVLRACPKLEAFGLCSEYIDNQCLLMAIDLCPRLAELDLDHSGVTNPGVMEFCRGFQRRRSELYGFSVGVRVDVSYSNCTRRLSTQAIDEFGDRFTIVFRQEVDW